MFWVHYYYNIVFSWTANNETGSNFWTLISKAA